MPVYLMQDMPYDEFLKWNEFFFRYPIGWREDYRTSLIMRAQGVKASSEEIFPTLRRLREQPLEQGATAAIKPGSTIFGMLQSAKGGDQIPL